MHTDTPAEKQQKKKDTDPRTAASRLCCLHAQWRQLQGMLARTARINGGVSTCCLQSSCHKQRLHGVRATMATSSRRKSTGGVKPADLQQNHLNNIVTQAMSSRDVVISHPLRNVLPQEPTPNHDTRYRYHQGEQKTSTYRTKKQTRIATASEAGMNFCQVGFLRRSCTRTICKRYLNPRR